MIQAQKEVYEMFGVSVDDFKDQLTTPEQPATRRKSMSAIPDTAKSIGTPTSRPNSEVLSPPPTQREWPL